MGLIALTLALFVLAAGSAVWLVIQTADIALLGTTLHGANIDHAEELLLVGGLVGALLTGMTLYNRRFLLVTALLGACLMGAALTLLGLDSAVYRTDSGTDRLGGFYIVWGILFALFLLEAVVLLVVPWDTASAYARSSKAQVRAVR